MTRDPTDVETGFADEALLKRIPATGDLLLLWNNVPSERVPHERP